MRRLGIALCLFCLALPAQALGARGKAGVAERLAERTILDLENVLADARAGLAEMAELPSVRAQDAAACDADSQAFTDARYTAAGAADLEGDLYCLSTGITSPTSIADRAYFLRAIGTRDLGVGDFQIGRVTGVNSIGLGFPVVDPSGAVTGITLSPLSLDWLGNRIVRRRSEKAIETLVVDGHGTVLAQDGPRANPSGTNLGRNRLVRSMLTDDFGTGRFRVGGTRVASAWGVVPLSEGAIHVAVSVVR